MIKILKNSIYIYIFNENFILIIKFLVGSPDRTF